MFKEDSNFFKHCFLFQYPDAPNLFSNVRRPYRPSISTVFRRGWLTNVLGILMVVTGSGLLVWNEVGYKFSSLIDSQYQCYNYDCVFGSTVFRFWKPYLYLLETNSYDDKSFRRRPSFRFGTRNNFCCIWWEQWQIGLNQVDNNVRQQ